ncbi:hypothetical protein [Caballeronia sp. GAFFF1]|uniref:hypothetical protein n=1 Tax=Caballeronia sp. GAFFF1 TaxID=2921779 RepID=UPI0020296410|nr:hypothetical protein [Caballeronia sp. GAFFF1]
MIDFHGEATSELDAMPTNNELGATPTFHEANDGKNEAPAPALGHRDAPGLSAIEKAIAHCEEQVRLQADRLLRQIEAGNDPTHSQKLLSIYQSSLIALKRSREALHSQYIFRSRFRVH